MTDKVTEKELNRLRRLPENMLCPNCGRKDTMFGFSAVCWQFKTFVCGECKSAHQSFSHRCKSVTMSNWTMDEVRQLDGKNGGGNKIAHERWVAGAPDSSKPNDKSSLDTIKRFIDRAYNQKAWETEYHGDSGRDRDEDRRRSSAAGPENNTIGGGRVETPSLCHSRGSRVAAPPPAAKAPAPAPVANLLDDMFDPPAATSAAPAPQPTAISAAPQQQSFDPFGLNVAPAPAAAFAPAMFDPAPQSGLTSAPAPAAFDPFSLPSAGGVAQGQMPQLQQPMQQLQQPMQHAQQQPQFFQQQAQQAVAPSSQCGMFNQFCQAQQQQPQQGMGAVSFAGGMGASMQPQQGNMQCMGATDVSPATGSSSAFGFVGYNGAQATGMQALGGMQAPPPAPWPNMQGQTMQATPRQQGAFDPFRASGSSAAAQAPSQPMFPQNAQGGVAQPAAFDAFAVGGFRQAPPPQQQQQMPQVGVAGMAQGGVFNSMGQMQQQQQQQLQMQQMQQMQPQQQKQAAEMFDPFAPTGSQPMAVHA